MRALATLLLALALAWPAAARTPARVGPLDVQQALTEIAGSSPTGPATARLLATVLTNRNNARLAGAAGDGTTDDLSALRSAAADGPVFLPDGAYYTGTSIYAMPAGRWWSGDGAGRLELRESGVTRRGPRNLAVINAQPKTNPGYRDGGAPTAFDADFSRVHTVAATLITGAATLGTPTKGYRINPFAGMQYFNLTNRSGHNQSLTGNAGRTNVAQSYYRFSHAGQGDLNSIFVNGFVTGTQPGATSFLANAAGSMLGGQIFAGANGVYLQGIGDINLNDHGFDVTGIGLVLNSRRSNGHGALGATWMSLRPQSGGPVAIDAFYSAAGRARIGIDMTGVVLQDLTGKPTQTAITLKAGQAIYGNATNTNPTRFARYTNPGGEWLEYTGTAWQMVVGSVPILQASASGLATPALRVAAPQVPATAHSACAKGQISYDASYAYICVATDTWKRAALASW